MLDCVDPSQSNGFCVLLLDLVFSILKSFRSSVGAGQARQRDAALHAGSGRPGQNAARTPRSKLLASARRNGRNRCQVKGNQQKMETTNAYLHHEVGINDERK